MLSFLRPASRLSPRSVRFSSSLAFLETANGKLTPASLSALTAAKDIGKPITALLVGPSSKEVSGEVSQISGVSKVLISTSEKYQRYLPEEISPLLVKLLTDASSDVSSFIIPASSVGKSILPRVAAQLDVQPISDITKVISPDTFVRPTYAGNALLTVKSTDKLIMTSVRGSAFSAVDITSSGSSAPIEEVPYVESGCKTIWVDEKLMQSDKPDLASAKVVLSGGRALKDKEHFESLLNPLAKKLHAAIGASRAAVDDGYCDNSLQVGQTGKIIAPDLYIAVGISGAIQHLAGMKDSKVIVAINKDEEAPIFKIADIGLVGDLYKIIPELTEKL